MDKLNGLRADLARANSVYEDIKYRMDNAKDPLTMDFLQKDHNTVFQLKVQIEAELAEFLGPLKAQYPTLCEDLMKLDAEIPVCQARMRGASVDKDTQLVDQLEKECQVMLTVRRNLEAIIADQLPEYA